MRYEIRVSHPYMVFTLTMETRTLIGAVIKSLRYRYSHAPFFVTIVKKEN